MHSYLVLLSDDVLLPASKELIKLTPCEPAPMVL
ncbi:hypothetical protein CPS_0504 [Colwellia psychrerythraea 34H]|uniref:Uncharacterized protein n=1 Tax=Colwellia psychrerythraea (strain 34H / ATCC BAA-681) TaxID=167879 RepID=Q489K2_COLP3|nr:hypothetical protein CPS_0504 [Colwellia psychrerythraea 34H]